MTIDRSFQTENVAERARMQALVARLTDPDLQRSLGHRWTVADALLHLAFWDLRAVVLMDRFGREGVGPSAMDVEAANDTVWAMGRGLPPRAAAELAVRAAETAARRIEALPDQLVEAILARPDAPFTLARHEHWREHLDDIERGLR